MRPMLALLLFPALACSTPPSPSGTPEAGTDSAADAADESCFPFCSSSSGGGSGGSSGGDDGGSDASCATLKSQIDQLQAPAQTCNPSLSNQCTGIVQGICCPITVNPGNDPQANAFQQAVDVYKGQCDASCLTPVCPPTPSLDCQATPGQPSQGRCN